LARLDIYLQETIETHTRLGPKFELLLNKLIQYICVVLLKLKGRRNTPNRRFEGVLNNSCYHKSPYRQVGV